MACEQSITNPQRIALDAATSQTYSLGVPPQTLAPVISNYDIKKKFNQMVY